MQSLVLNCINDKIGYNQIAKSSYKMADEMMIERARSIEKMIIKWKKQNE